MPTVQHNTLTTTDLHEPKGAAGASADEVYIADGLGSGSWGPMALPGAMIYTPSSASQSISTIGTTAQTLPFTNDGPSNGVTADSANNRLTLTDAGTYWVSFHTSYSIAASGDAGTYSFVIQDDAADTNLHVDREMAGSSDTASVGIAGLLTVGAGSQLTVSLSSDEAAGTDDINVSTSTLVAMRVF